MKMILVINFTFFLLSIINLNKGICQGWYPLKVSPDWFVMKLYNHKNKLYVGGYFIKCGNLIVNNLATWDGFKWEKIGNGLSGFTSENTMYNYNEKFVLGSHFSIDCNSCDTTSFAIAQWDSMKWKSIGNSKIWFYAEGSIFSIILYKDKLYAAGNIWLYDSIPVHRILSFDGATWSEVSGGVTWGMENIESMSEYHNELYIGGNFYKAGDLWCKNIARWNGESWDSVAWGVDDYVTVMCVDSIRDVLYVAGGFSRAGNVNVNGIAKWDGSKWSSLGNDYMVGLGSLKMYHGDLYAGGANFGGILENGEFTKNIFRWDGKEWHTVGGGTNQGPTTLEIFNDTLFIGGLFNKVGQYDEIDAPYLVKWYSPDAYADSCGYNSSYCPKPQAGFSADSINGFSYVFNNATTGSCTFKWYFGDGDSATALSPTHIYQDTGIYQVTLVAFAGLRSDTVSQPIIIYSTGMNEISHPSEKLEIIPNPSGQTVLFKYRVPSAGSATLKITTLSGEILKIYPLENSKTTLEISTVEFRQGLYLCKLVNDKGKVLQYRKMVVVR